MLRPILALLLSAALAPFSPSLAANDFARQVEDLVARMTLEEKIGQLNLVSHGPLFPGYDFLRQGRAGAVINFNNPQDIAAAQKAARESRLGIPLLFSLDVLHGFRTIYPVPLAETATFNPALSRLASEWAAREAAYIGVQWTFAPMADISRDPRWGRIVEGSGEDPHVGRVFAAARVEGFRAGGLATGAKHFAGYGKVVGGRDYDATEVPITTLRDVVLLPFRAAVEAGSLSLMSAFNSLNGLPATANPWLLTDVLRGEWGFDGFVVSDWAAIEELLGHGLAADGAEAARKAFLAGVDMDLMGRLYERHLADEVKAGRVPSARVDDAVRRVLRAKFRLGLFDRPDADASRSDAVFPTPQSREVSLTVARETLVLLQNRDGALPLRAPTRSVAVVGGLATGRFDLLGPHAARGHEEDTVPLLDALRGRAATADVALSFAAGCDPLCGGDVGFAEAIETARAADMIVAVLGEPRDMSGEAASRAYLGLPGGQPQLLEALVATGKPVVVVLLGGRPLELGPIAEKLSAILMTWYPGTEGAAAITETLFGDVNPSGKLPLTWPRTVGQVPIYYNHLPSGRPTEPSQRFTRNYLDVPIDPLFPFGFGLSYTTFAFSDPIIATPKLKSTDTLAVQVEIKNTGERAGKEVAQLYIRDPVASRSRPVRELKAFEKIALAPGETRVVTLRVPVRELGFHLDDGTYVVEPGRFEVGVGGDSRASLTASFEVTDGLRLPPRASAAPANDNPQPARSRRQGRS
jgi:beta-glucosidase